MKQFIKTTIAAIFGLALFAGSAHAQAVFNNPGEMPTVTISNSTRTVCSFGAIVGCWQPSTTAQAGDVVAVHVYYHNTSNTAAQGTALSIKPGSAGPATSVTFTGGVASLSGPRSVGSASVTLSSSQTLTYVSGSARWTPSISSGPRAVDSSALFGTGFNIGTVNPGEQGTLVAFFKVGNDVVQQQECFIDSFSANPTTVSSGGYTTLSWNTTNCDQVMIDGATQAIDGSGSFGPIYNSRSYEIRASRNGVVKTQSVYVSVNQIINNQCDASFYANTTNVPSGNPVTLTWNTTGLSSVTIYPTLGSQNTSGSTTVYPTSSTTYTLTGYGCGNNYTRTVTINVASVISNTQPQAITTVATPAQTSARINGIAVPNTTYPTTAWFEWGTSGSLGSRTNAQSVINSTNTPISDSVYNLVPGGVYYYRTVVQNQNGTAYGSIERFQTQKNTVIINNPPKGITRVVTRDVVVAKSAASLLELRVENVYDRMCIAGEMDYTVSYRNISGQTLQNAVLRIAHPKELTFINSSRGDYEVVDRTVTIALGDIPAGGQGTVQVRARVNTSAVVGNLAVTTATVVYTNTISRAQEDAIAYSLVTVSNDCPSTNNLGANAFGIGSFFPNTLLGWLLLIVVILALIVLGRQIYKKKE